MNISVDAFRAAYQERDVRTRRCGGCGTLYLPRRGDSGMCSDRCYVRSPDRHRPPQNETLNRAAQRTGDLADRRAAARYRVNTLLADAALDNTVRAYQRRRTETMGLISRLMSRADPYARFASRGSAAERHALGGAAQDVPERGGGVISRSAGVLPAERCSFIHPHTGPCQLARAFL